MTCGLADPPGAACNLAARVPPRTRGWTAGLPAEGHCDGVRPEPAGDPRRHDRLAATPHGTRSTGILSAPLVDGLVLVRVLPDGWVVRSGGGL
jgi:hypothetical protein